jgi:hypothetical protein
MQRRRRVVAVLATLAASLALAAGSASAADWAGLGDSYAAGPLIPNQQLNPPGCLRSDHNFAHLAAARPSVPARSHRRLRAPGRPPAGKD